MGGGIGSVQKWEKGRRKCLEVEVGNKECFEVGEGK